MCDTVSRSEQTTHVLITHPATLTPDVIITAYYALHDGNDVLSQKLRIVNGGQRQIRRQIATEFLVVLVQKLDGRGQRQLHH